MKRALTAMEACRQGGHDDEHLFSRAAKMVEIGSGARRAIADHIEDVLGMVEIGAGAGLPYEEIVRLKLRALDGKQRDPVTSGHRFKGGDSLSLPLWQTLDSALWNFRSVRLESRQGGRR